MRWIERRELLLGLVATATGGLDSAAGPEGQSTMTHVVLLGDSVFDNGAYVGNGPETIRQLRDILPAGWRATMLAQDGAKIADLQSQLQRLPSDATHLVVSIGGNDALRDSHVLEEPARSVSEGLLKVAAVRDAFRADYQAMLQEALSRNLPLAVCSIYDPRFSDALQRRIGSAALAALNDAITREAFVRNVALIDLRLICDSDRDFANPIEPSVQGGAKITRAICRWATNAELPRSVVIAR
jgi:hypothetical protein